MVQSANPEDRTKALRVLSGKVVKRRGGKRALKKRLGIIDIGKEMDKTKFGIGEDDEYGDSAMGIIFGMLGKDETGKIKMSDRKILKDGHPNKKLKKRKSLQTTSTI